MLAAFVKFVDCGYYTIFKCTYHCTECSSTTARYELRVGEGGLVGGEWTTKSPRYWRIFAHFVHANPRW